MPCEKDPRNGEKSYCSNGRNIISSLLPSGKIAVVPVFLALRNFFSGGRRGNFISTPVSPATAEELFSLLLSLSDKWRMVRRHPSDADAPIFFVKKCPTEKQEVLSCCYKTGRRRNVNPFPRRKRIPVNIPFPFQPVPTQYSETEGFSFFLSPVGNYSVSKFGIRQHTPSHKSEEKESFF